METHAHGKCCIDTNFRNSLRTRVPISLASASLSDAPQVACNLKCESWLANNIKNVNNVSSSSIVGLATLRFRDRVLKDAFFLSNANVTDVALFIDSCVDVSLLDERAQELAKEFSACKSNKVVAVAGSGTTMPSAGSLTITAPIDKHLQVHVARVSTQRSILMSDTDKVTCKSNTFNEKNNENELRVQKKMLMMTIMC